MAASTMRAQVRPRKSQVPRPINGISVRGDMDGSVENGPRLHTLESFNIGNNAIAWIMPNSFISHRSRAMIRAAGAILLSWTLTAFAVGAQDFNLVIRDHRFEPAEIRVPADKRVSLYVANEDATPEEFDSSALKVEKVIAGRSKALIRIGPLTAGRYEFIGEFHADTAKGVVIVE